MKTHRNKHISIYCILILFAITAGACGTKKKANSKTKYIPFPINCMSNGDLSSFETNTFPFNLYVYIKKIEVNGVTYNINKEFKREIEYETDLIVLNDTFAVKVFHNQSIEYGNNRHFFRCDFLKKTPDCWSILYGTSFQEISISNHDAESAKINLTNNAVSKGIADGQQRFAIEWAYAWVKF